MSVVSLLAYALFVMTCTAKGKSIDVTTQNAPNMRGHEVEQCQYTEFSRRREECNKNVNFLASRKGNDCHVMQIYVDCLTMALRNTGCTTNPFFLTSESNLIRRKVRDKNLTCDLYSDDCVGFKEIRSLRDNETLQSNLRTISLWSQKSKMSLDVRKCCYTTFTNRFHKLDRSFTVNSSIITNECDYKYLGIY